jgi:hypothetical protein
MSIARRGGVDNIVLISGGAGDPGVYAGTVDPSAGGGVVAAEGSLFERYVAAGGEVWIKTGAAATAWTQIVSGGGITNPLILKTGDAAGVVTAPVGQASGAIGHIEGGNNSSVKVAGAASGLAMGYIENTPNSNTANIEARGLGSFAMGYINNTNDAWCQIYARAGAVAHGYILGDEYTGEITANAFGAHAGGYVRSAGNTGPGYGNTYVTASGRGAFAHGWAYSGYVGSGARVYAGHHGAAAFGYAYSGQVQALDPGAFACGVARNGGDVNADGPGSFAHGYTRNDGLVESEQNGSFVTGYAEGAGSSVQALSGGSFAAGYSNSAGDVIADGKGAFAHGYAKDTGRIYAGGAAGKGALASGYAYDNSVLEATGEGAQAFGFAEEDCHILASGPGNQARGYTYRSGRITADGWGSFSGGGASYGEAAIRPIPDRGTAVLLTRVSSGSFAMGYASGGDGGYGWAKIEANGDGSFAMGYAYKYRPYVWSQITASGQGAFAMGATEEGGNITASGDGTLAGGWAEGSGSQDPGDPGGVILANDQGAFAWGAVYKAEGAASVGEIEAINEGAWAGGFVRAEAAATGLIRAGGRGSFAHGYVLDGEIQAPSAGAHAFGSAIDGADIGASGRGSFAFGSSDNGNNIDATGEGSFAGGFADSYSVRATAAGALAFGNATGAGAILASAVNAIQFGTGVNNIPNSMKVGTRFQARGTGQFGGANNPVTLGVGVTTMATSSSLMTVTGDALGNTIATITNGFSGQELVLLFVDGLVTITDDNTHAANSVDLAAAFTSADDTVLRLIFDGTSWYEVSRSIN